jgi:hypothetical protein
MIKVVFWSQTGNTEAMADAVVEGIKAAGKEGKAISVSDISASEIAGEEVFALGCPAMGDETLDEGEMEPFVEELIPSVTGKKIALFGSYDWGDGEWMRSWEARMKEAGALLVAEPVICNLTPDEEGLANCKALGEALAKA